MPKKTEVTPLVKYKEVLYPLAKLDSVIVDAAKDGEKLKYKLHNIGLSIISLWGPKKIEGKQAADFFNALIKASGYHGKAVAEWVKMKTPLMYSEEVKAFYCPPDAKVNQETFIAAKAEPFWEVSPPPEAKPFNALALIEAILSKQVKRAENAKEGDRLLSNEAVSRIKALLNEEKMKDEPAH